MLVRSYEDPSSRIARTGNVLLSISTGLPTAARLAGLRQGLRALANEKGPVASLMIVAPTRSTSLELSDALRQEASAVFRQLASRPDALVALVIDGAGFVGAGLRSLFSGILLVARVPYATKTLSTREDGVRAVVEHTTPLAERPSRIRAVQEHVEALQAEIRPPA